MTRAGHITSWVNYFPADEIARIEQVCATPEGQGVLLNDQPCRQFIEQAKAYSDPTKECRVFRPCGDNRAKRRRA
jgi:hypothetical protein